MKVKAKLTPGLSDKEREMLTAVFNGGITHAVIPLQERLLIVSKDDSESLLPHEYYPLEISVYENTYNNAVEVRCYVKGCANSE